MSRNSVRKAVAAFIAPPHVTGIQTVARSAPRLISGGDFKLTGGRRSGTVAVVHINNEHEYPIDFNGGGGYRMVEYQIGILLRFKSMKLDPDTDLGVYIDDYDATVEALKARIRSDPRLGTSVDTPPYIFTAGMGGTSGPIGSPDLEMTSDLPRINKGTSTLWIWGRLDMRASETNVPIA